VKLTDNKIRSLANTNIQEINSFNYPIKELNNELTINDLDAPEKYFESGVFKYNSVNILHNGDTFGESGLVLL
jgi:hypothetical protein